MTDTALHGRIAKLYDDTTRGWLDVWGEHLHHGYYGPAGDEKKDHLQAQEDMVDAVFDWAGPPPDGKIERLFDAGCGVGGSSRHLSRRLGAQAHGYTLSPVQKALGDELSGGLPVQLTVGDATRTGLPDGSFDLVWALESGEHMPDKLAFMREMCRLLRPGGRLIVATWCHRPLPPALGRREQWRLNAISRSFGSSLTWVPLSHYEQLAAQLPLAELRTADWSETISPFWSAVSRSVATRKGVRALLEGGRSMVRGAVGGLHMQAAVQSQLVRYVLLTAVRTESV